VLETKLGNNYQNLGYIVLDNLFKILTVKCSRTQTYVHTREKIYIVVRVLVLQIRRPGFDSRHYQIKKSSESGTGSTQPREYT
jgi:hypothetical protein